MVVLGLALSVGCRASSDVPETGAVLLRVTIPPRGPFPDELRAWVYDASGVLFSDSRLPAKGALPQPSGSSLGTVLLQPGAATGPLRIHVRGLVASTHRLEGVVSVGPSRGTVDLVLRADILPDGDLDDVPDLIDDCPAVSNPTQGPCPTNDAAMPADATPARDVAGAVDASTVSDAATPGDAPPTQDAGAADGAFADVQGRDAATPDTVVPDAAGGAADRPAAVDSGGGAADRPAAVDSGGSSIPDGGSAGCGIAPSGVAEGLVTLTMTEGGAAVDRQYWLSRPASYDPRQAYKVIVGLGSPASDATAIRAQLGVQGGAVTPSADEIFVYPLARTRTFGTWGTIVGWQLGPGARDSNAAGLDDLAFIDAMLDDVTRRHCVDKSRVFVVGHGWGSDFTHALGCLRGGVLRAVMGSATNGDYYLVSPPVACAGTVNTWTLHGKGDTHLPLATGMTALGYWLDRHTCAQTTQSLIVPGPSGNEDCVRHLGCTAETRWCAYDTSFGGGVPSYLGREAMKFFREF